MVSVQRSAVSYQLEHWNEQALPQLARKLTHVGKRHKLRPDG
jgi:hypothetical protein